MQIESPVFIKSKFSGVVFHVAILKEYKAVLTCENTLSIAASAAVAAAYSIVFSALSISFTKGLQTFVRCSLG